MWGSCLRKLRCGVETASRCRVCDVERNFRPKVGLEFPHGSGAKVQRPVYLSVLAVL